MAPRHLTRALLAVVLAFALAGCGGSDDEAADTTTTTEVTTTTTPAITTTTTATTTTSATTTVATTTATQATTIRIQVVGGKPAGGIARPSVDRGDHVV